MKENMLDVLMYLFDNYIDEEEEASDQESLKVELAEAGFPQIEIEKAFEWLEELTVLQKNAPIHKNQNKQSMRVFSELEMKKIGPDCRGFLMFMEQSDTLDEVNRELVIDRIMALETNEIDLEQLKWIVMMVLFNQPDQEESLAWLETLFLQEFTGVLH